MEIVHNLNRTLRNSFKFRYLVPFEPNTHGIFDHLGRVGVELDQIAQMKTNDCFVYVRIYLFFILVHSSFGLPREHFMNIYNQICWFNEKTNDITSFLSVLFISWLKQLTIRQKSFDRESFWMVTTLCAENDIRNFWWICIHRNEVGFGLTYLLCQWILNMSVHVPRK